MLFYTASSPVPDRVPVRWKSIGRMTTCVFNVSDDGVGLSREILESVNRYIAGKANEEDKKKLGIGTRNVVDRIRYVYGASGSISVLSDAEWGTSITLMLPIEVNQ